MRLSHSKLSLGLSNPMEYFLNYKMGISPKFEKTALSLGSAVHWGLEHGTEDLSEYFGNKLEYSHDELLAEAMCHGYFYYKNQIFDELLTDKDGTKATLLEENHEVFIDGKLKSFINKECHIFVGIIDLLLLTDKGFIIVDYKTSSNVPNWNDYLDQLYRYIFLLKSEFPDVPIYKLAIINLRKSRTRQTRGESNQSYQNRLFKDYELNDDSFVNWHVFNPNEFSLTFVKLYIDNLSKMADTLDIIDKNNAWYSNFGATNSYGGSVYKDIIYHTPDCHVLYTIKDKIYDEETNSFLDRRDCRKIDMLVVDYQNVLNKYELFEKAILELINVETDMSIEELNELLKNKYICDDELLDVYWQTFLKSK